MEDLDPQSLSNDEILRIFEERKLKIPDIDKLSRDELISIYNKFALPLNKRNKNHYKNLSSSRETKRSLMSIDDDVMNDGELTRNDEILDNRLNNCKRNRKNSIVVDDAVTKMARITLKLNVNKSSSSTSSSSSVNNNSNGSGNTLKRICPSEQILLLNKNTVTTTPSKRIKITWP